MIKYCLLEVKVQLNWSKRKKRSNSKKRRSNTDLLEIQLLLYLRPATPQVVFWYICGCRSVVGILLRIDDYFFLREWFLLFTFFTKISLRMSGSEHASGICVEFLVKQEVDFDTSFGTGHL